MRTQTMKLAKRPTLAELRTFVEATRDMPGDARIGVRTGFGGATRHGSRPTEITAVEEDPRAVSL